MKMKKLLCIAAALSIGLSGCGTKTEETSSLDFKSYPVNDDTVLTYWMPLYTNISSLYDNFGDTLFAKELEKETGIKVKYIHPAAGQENEALSLLIASGELPDIIEYPWYGYSGGGHRAVKDGVIESIDGVIKENSPNYMKYLDEHKDVVKEISSDDGSIFGYELIRGSLSLGINGTAIVRSDWMKELGLEQPKTTDDIENILTQFKEKKGCSAPLTGGLGSAVVLAGGNLEMRMYDGKVDYGPLRDNFKTALQTLNRWYKKGLLDNNFISSDSKTVDSNMLNGYSGVAYGGIGGLLGKWLDAKIGDADYGWLNIPGDEYAPNVNLTLSNAAAITTSCKNKALAARLLDYGYSEKGSMLYNFGTEGKSYTMKDGEPIYTDEILKNPDGLTVSQSMAINFRASTTGPFVQQEGYLKQFYGKPQQQEAWKNESAKAEEYRKRFVPNITYTDEENDEQADIMTEVSAYVKEYATKFITGSESFDNWDKFIAGMKEYKIDRAIEINQSAVDRYNKK